MDQIKRYELTKLHETNEFALVIYLEDYSTEFASELDGNEPERKNIVTSAKQIIKERYPNLKVTMVKVVIGGLAVTAIPLSLNTTNVEASEQQVNTTEAAHSDSIYYQVSPGETLWGISRQYNTTVDDIKIANHLVSNNVTVNQRIIVPKTFHHVIKGDSLLGLSKQYGISVNSIREANKLSTDTIRIGQTLVIPNIIEANTTDKQENIDTSTYTVVGGDSLSVIAKRFGVSIDSLRNVNNLTSDTITIGQVLTIPKASQEDVKPVEQTINYTVIAGDNLTTIAQRFGTTVDSIKNSNKLTTDLLRIGQVLSIPATSNIKTETSNGNYKVSAGDTLWGIAKQFNTTANTIKNANNLTSDTLTIGQTLVIPNQSTVQNKTSHTVKAGETLWGISRSYGVSVHALKAANNLTTDSLRLGQVLTVPTNNTDTGQSSTTEERSTFSYSVRSGDSLTAIANRFGVTVDSIRTANSLTTDFLRVGEVLTIPNGLNAPSSTGVHTITYTSHTIASGETIWDLSVRYGIPQAELLKVNNLTTSSRLSIGQTLKIPVHHIGVKEVVSEKHGEYLDWWSEAQYVFTIGKTAKVTDLDTGKSFYIKRTIGANHADSETITVNDTNIAKSIWGGFSWAPRAVILEIDGRKIAASMSFMPHEREFIANNGIDGHFDVYFGDSTRHKDGQADPAHQRQVERAAGLNQS